MHTTSLVAGLLFIAFGVVFLRYDGTAGLTGSMGMGDLTDLEYSAQRAVTEWAAHVPSWVPLLAVGLIALAVAWRRHEPGPRDDSSPRDEQFSQSEEDRTGVQ